MNNVLVVDDDPLTLRMYREGLLKHGFRVQACGGIAL